ncbi:CDP-alcohol phosphatidyltransferase family protein [candidate division KSB1 bacterium]
MKFLSDGVKEWYINLIDPVIKLFIRLEVHPNHLTTLGLLIQFFTVYFLAVGYFIISGILILMSGTCDIIDGQLARRRKIGTKFGALYDSVFDRYAEFALYFGIGYYFVNNEFHLYSDLVYSVITYLALGGSLMTSYIRARAEGLGIECKVGVMQRPERIVYIGFAALLSGIPALNPYPLIAVLIVIAVLSNYTAIQRLVHVYKSTDRGRELLKPYEKD